MNDQVSQAFAFAALEAIQGGDWDRYLHRLLGAIKTRQVTDAYQATLIAGQSRVSPPGASTMPL